MTLNFIETSRWLMRQPERRTAIHEAGHAVLAIIEHRPFDDILFQRDENSNAIVRNISCREGDDEVVRIGLAGIMAARMARNRWDRSLFDSARDDLGVIAEFVKQLENPRGTLEWNVKAAAQELEESWGAVELIASALIRMRTVAHTECLQLFQEGHLSTGKCLPPGKMGKLGWEPLYKKVEWRMKYPNGLQDILEEFGE